jgi:tellurite resistance protein TerC
MVQTVGTPALWSGFIALVLVFLALDLGVFHREDRPVSIGDALRWTAVWWTLSLGFAGLVAWRFGASRAVEYLTGYLIEQSLSVDNLFVFMVILGTFAIPPMYQHRVLFWGIVTALVLRGGMILTGTALLQRFHWLIYAFGAFLLVTGGKILLKRGEEEEPHPERSAAFRFLRRIIPATSALDGRRFLVRQAGGWVATPLLLALLLVEVSDVVFALDSVPAIFGVTLDPFIVFTSNIFAILGLRSLYFALAGLLDRFIHLQTGLALVLVFIGGKMLASPFFEIGQWASLLVVVVLLGGAVGLSAFRGPGPDVPGDPGAAG